MNPWVRWLEEQIAAHQAEGLEIWRGTECVGTISAELLTLIVAHYLQDTALRESVRLELLAVARRPAMMRRKQ